MIISAAYTHGGCIRVAYDPLQMEYEDDLLVMMLSQRGHVLSSARRICLASSMPASRSPRPPSYAVRAVSRVGIFVDRWSRPEACQGLRMHDGVAPRGEVLRRGAHSRHGCSPSARTACPPR
jgi:hypothetical protein